MTATFDGDASLRKRPMRRVLDPLEKMGARVIEAADGGRLPLTLRGARDPMPIIYESPVPSAQLKSAVLLAGLVGAGRDHGDRSRSHARPHRAHAQAFRRQGRRASPMASTAAASRSPASRSLSRRHVVVPADPSSAAFPLVAALIVPGSELILEAVMTNPLRTGLLDDVARDGRQASRRWKRATTAARRSPICASSRPAAQGRRRAGGARAVDDRRISGAGGGRRLLPKAQRACAA